MSGVVRVNLPQLRSAVHGSDAVTKLRRPPTVEALALVDITVSALVFAAIGRSVDLDLGNGHALRCTLVKTAAGRRA